MSERYPGGYIIKNPQQPTAFSAPGIWTLDQALQYTQAGNWPGVNRGYLFGAGYDYYGSLNLSNNYLAGYGLTGFAQTMYYGPWTSISKGTPAATNSIRAFLVKADGTLWAVGNNTMGSLGLNQLAGNANYEFINTPTQVGTSTDWANAKLFCGILGVYAVKSNGTLWSWGDNSYGNLGHGDTVNRSSPTQVGSDTTWVNVISTKSGVIAYKSNGTLWAFGRNDQGQLGLNNRTNYSSPVQIGALTNWTEKISAGEDYWHAIKSDGTLWGCGINGVWGNLGDGTRVSRSSPVQIGALTTWSNVSSTGESTFGITTSGALWAWGNGVNGALGTNSQTSRSSPVQVGALTNWSYVYYRAIRSAAAVKTDGTLWIWGENNTPLSVPNVNYSSPVQVGSATNWLQVGNPYRTYRFDGKTQRGNPSILVLTTEKTYLWGSGAAPDTATFGAPVQAVSWPVLLDQSASKWISVSTVGNDATYPSPNTLAVRSDGTLWAIGGLNNYGDLGTNDALAKSSPVQVGSLTNWNMVAINTGAHAIKSDGTLWGWGINVDGQTGTNNRTTRSSPVQVGALTDWKYVYAGYCTAYAIKKDNTLWAWGYNQNYGPLGDGTTTSRSSPVQIGSLSDWSMIAGGYWNAFAVKTDGTLWSWGYNGNGVLGHNNSIDRSSPVQVGALTNWLKVATNGYTTLAIKTDGTLWAWGINTYGQVGNNTTLNRDSPVQIGSNTNWGDIAVGKASYAITTSGVLYGWGLLSIVTNTVGTEVVIYRSSPVQIGGESYYTRLFGGSVSATIANQSIVALTNDY